MKIFLTLALILAVSNAALNYDQAMKKLSFEVDSHKDSPIGIVLKGHVDTENKLSSQASAYLKLANEVIPLLESVGYADGSRRLAYGHKWCVGKLGVAQACFNVDGSFVVGWNAVQTGAQGLYQVSYAPFVTAWFGGNVTANIAPANLGYGAYITPLNLSMPITLAIAKNQVCFESNV